MCVCLSVCAMQGSMSRVVCRVVCVNNVTTLLPVHCVMCSTLSTFLQSTLYLHKTLQCLSGLVVALM